MRKRRAGILDALIEKVTDTGYQSEFATLLDVSRFSVYKWNLGESPSLFHMMQINMLCDDAGLKHIYKVKLPRPGQNGAT